METRTNPSPKVILHGFALVTMKVLNSYDKAKKDADGIFFNAYELIRKLAAVAA